MDLEKVIETAGEGGGIIKAARKVATLPPSGRKFTPYPAKRSFTKERQRCCEHGIRVLNVAGPRESKPRGGVYRPALAYLR